MKTTEKLPTNYAFTREPFPNSKKVYVSGTIHPDIKVAMREIKVADGIAKKNGNSPPSQIGRAHV